MKKSLFLCILLLECIAGNSQNSLKGTVKSKITHENLPGAILYFPDLKTGVATKQDGSYSINNLPKIRTLMEVKLLGYKTFVKQIDLTSTQNFDVEMEESAVEADEVVVTGTSHATEIKRSPVPMALIDQKYLNQNSATNIIDAISKIPGINAVSTGPNVSKPYIRGLGFNRILTLFDGMRQDGQQWGDEHGIEVDQYLINRIEVIKGPASLIYGSDALAGVINLIPENTAPDGTLKGSLTSNYQSNNRQLANSLALAGNKRGFVWGFRGSQKVATNYQNKFDGRVYGTKYKETDLMAYVGVNKPWGYSHLSFTLYDNQQEIPDGSRDSASRKFTKQISEEDTLRPIVNSSELSSYDIAAIHQRVQHYRIYSSNNFFFGKSKLGVRLGFQQSERREYSHPLYPDLAGLNLILNTSTYDFKYSLPSRKGWETMLGVNGMYQLNKNNGATEFVIPNYHSFDVGPFAFCKKSLGKFDLAAGIRYDARYFQNDSMFTRPDAVTGFDGQVTSNFSDSNTVKQFGYYKHTFNGFSGSFGATYNLNDKFCIKVNVARGYRSPNIAEISAKGVHPGTGFEQLGDPNFKPEFSLQEDIGMFFNSEHISGSMELFNNVIQNYIYNEKLQSALGGDSIFTQAGNEYPVFKFRQTKAQLYGGEFSFDIHPHPFDWLHFENTASLVYATNLGGNGAHITDSTKYLPYIPPFHTNSELRAEVKKNILCFSNLFIKVGMQYFAAQDRFYSAFGTETKTSSYVLLNAGIGTNVIDKKGKTLFVFNISGNNLSDVPYQSNMSRLKYFDNYPNNSTGRSGIYNMGRNISFKLIIPVNIERKG